MSSNQSISVGSTQADSILVYSITVDSSENVAILPSGDTNRMPSPTLGKVKETRIRPNGEEISSRWLDTAFAQSNAGKMRDFGSFFFKLPAGSVDTGATWHQDKVDTAGTPGGGGNIIVNTSTDYKLTGQQSVNGIPCAKIEFTGKVTMNGSASIQGMDLTITGKGTVTGSVLFDYGAGRVVGISGSSNQDLTMVSSGENAMTIPINQQTSYELSVVK
jgi:hypothetical protein